MRTALLRRMESYRAAEILSVPQYRGGRTFFEVRSHDEDGTLHQRIVLEEGGRRHVLADSATLPETSSFGTYSGSGTASFQASPDGRYLAYGVRRGNSIWTRWYVVEVASGERLDDEVRGLSTRVASTVSFASRWPSDVNRGPCSGPTKHVPEANRPVEEPPAASQRRCTR